MALLRRDILRHLCSGWLRARYKLLWRNNEIQSDDCIHALQLQRNWVFEFLKVANQHMTPHMDEALTISIRIANQEEKLHQSNCKSNDLLGRKSLKEHLLNLN